MSEELVVVAEEIVVAPGRALEVKIEIERLRGNLHDGLFDLAELLAEARKNAYHQDYGFSRFGEWVEQGSGLDMSERTAYYLVRLIENAKELGIPRSQLRAAKMSKLKEIFALDHHVHGDAMRQLVGECQYLPLLEVRERINKIKAVEGVEPYVYVTLKIPKSVKEQTVDPAFELVRRQYGDARDPLTGEVMDVSDSKCIEFICTNYINDPNNTGEI